MRRDGRSLGRVLVLAAVLASTGAPAAYAQGADAGAFHSPGCEAGVFAFLAADPAAVRAEGRVPVRWKLALDSDGKARLFLDMASCQMTLGGRTRTVVYTNLAAQLDSASLPSPERQRSTSNVEGKPNDYYLLAWNAADHDFVRWMQTGTGLGDIARLVPGLTFQLAAGEAEREFAFGAPKPNQSPFQLTATVLRPVIPVYPITINFWRETPVGSVMLETSHDLPYLFGFFEQWTLKTDPTSPLGRMIGGDEQVRTCAATALPAPLIGQGGTDPGCLGVNEPNGRWTFRKDLPPGGGPGEAAASGCASRRRFRISLPRTWRTATVRLGGRPLKVTPRGGRLSAIVDLRGRPPGTVRLRAVGRTSAGRRVAQTRVYRLCGKGRTDAP